MAALQKVAHAPRLAPRPVGRAMPRVVAQAVQNKKVAPEVMRTAAAATVVVGAMQLAAATVPEAALAAARSGGRVSSSGFAARRQGITPSQRSTATAATSRTAAAAPASSTTVVHHHHTTVVAPSPMFGFGGFGFGMPFGGFGFGFRPVFVTPVPFLGGFLTFLLGMLAVGAIFGLARAAIGAASGNKKKSSTEWDSL